MKARDVSPSRLTIAQRKVADLVRHLKNESPGDRVGLVLFAGESYLFCPLTSDYGVFKVFLDSLSSDLITARGSNLSKAFQTAIDSVHSSHATIPRLLLISDGEDNELVIKEATSKLKQASLTVDAIGVGTLEGTTLDGGGGESLRDRQGAVVVSKLLEHSLQEISSSTGGIYQRATIDDSDIVRIINARKSTNLGDSKGQSRTLTVYREVGPYCLWGALIIIAALLVVRPPYAMLPLLLVGVLSVSSAYAEDLRDGAEAYKQGDYKRALDLFQAEYERDTSNLKALQGAGSSAFKLKEYAKAEKLFHELSEKAQSGRERFIGLYNEGNTLLAEKKFQDAIDAYDRALAIKKSDEETTFNRNLAEKLKVQEEEQKKQKQDQNRDKEKNPDKKKSDPREKKDRDENSKEKDHEETSPSGSPTKSPTPNDESSKKEESSPSPSATSSPGKRSSPTSSPTSSPSSNPTSQGEDKNDSVSPYRPDGSPTPVSKEKLSEDEAKAWLDSLSDDPVLIRRMVGRSSPEEGQTW